MEIEIVDTILTLKFESLYNRSPNSSCLESESLSIQFWNSNCLSLPRLFTWASKFLFRSIEKKNSEENFIAETDSLGTIIYQAATISP